MLLWVGDGVGHSSECGTFLFRNPTVELNSYCQPPYLTTCGLDTSLISAVRMADLIKNFSRQESVCFYAFLDFLTLPGEQQLQVGFRRLWRIKLKIKSILNLQVNLSQQQHCSV